MRNLIVAFGLLISTVHPGFGGMAAPADDRLSASAVVDRMAQSFASLRSLSASLTQQKKYAQLGLTDPQERGSLYIKRKGDRDIQVRVEINVPEQRIITVKDGKYLIFQPALNQAIEGVVDKNSAATRAAASFFTYLLGGVSKAAEDYSVSAAGEESVQKRRTVHLKLIPLPARRLLYKQVDLWVDKESWIPVQQQFIESNRDETTIQLIDIQTNIKVDDSLFTQKLPKNAQRVRG